MTFTEFLDNIAKNKEAISNPLCFGEHITYEKTDTGIRFLFESVYCMGSSYTKTIINNQTVEIYSSEGKPQFEVVINGGRKRHFSRARPTSSFVSYLLNIGD